MSGRGSGSGCGGGGGGGRGGRGGGGGGRGGRGGGGGGRGGRGGGGRGSGGGRGGHGSSGSNVATPTPPSHYPAPSAATPSHYPAPSAATPSTAQSLSHGMEQMSLSSTQPSRPPVQSAVQAPVQVPAPERDLKVVSPPASSKAVRFPSRPGFGTAGVKCVVRANHFLVRVADRDLNHYDVTITPEVASKKVCRDIMKNLVKEYSGSYLGGRLIAYDGSKSAYTAGELPFTSKDFVVKLIDNDRVARREREFKVSIKFAAKHSLFHLQQFLQGRQLDSPQETIQVLDVALRTNLSLDNQVVGRSLFAEKFGKGHLADGLDYWKGFYQSLRPCQMGLSLNIDVSARAFYEPCFVSDFILKFLNVRDLNRPLSDQDRVKVKKNLKGVRVEFNHQDYIRRYRISGLSSQPANQLMFELDTGAKTSVVQYFRQKYNIVIKHPMLPAIQSGSDAKPVYMPMEVCKIVKGQRYSRKLNDRQVSQLLKANCQRPNERQNSIYDVVKENKYNTDSVTQQFGMELSTDLTVIDARVLPPPMLKYHDTGSESRVDPRVGQWNMINKKMIDAARVNFWTCVNFSRCNDPERFCGELIDMCCSKGMEFNPSPLVPVRSAPAGQIEKALGTIDVECKKRIAQMKQSGALQLLIIILPEQSGSYGKIKRICETELGIVSQCCQPKQATKYNNKQYLENVSLKINVKVGGRNCFLELAVQRKIPFLTDRPTIIFGADVTHPQPGEDSGPSIAAVVASMDWPYVTKYRGLVSAQKHREEIIQGLYQTHVDPKKGVVSGGMIRELLIEFRRSTGHKPDRIIFYRDGVSEGQFSQVLLHEMDAIRKACSSLENGYLPRVTFVVVQKRHHTRLFPAVHGDRRTADRSGNILPGTVVDRKICHPTEFDFYLCSHAGIQGTSRPAHYHVLFDENGFTADALQNLTNCLCYTYARCTRSVSIVPPAYYAHLAAFRARYYIEGEYSDSESGGNPTRENAATDVRSLPVIKDNVKAVMFYC